MPAENNQPEQRKRIKRSSGTRTGSPSERAAVKPHKRESSDSASSQQPKPTSAAVKPTSQAAATSSSAKPTASASSSTKPTTNTLDISALLNSWARSLGNTQLAQTYVGTTLSRKEQQARKQFGVPDKEQVILVLDATIFGTCKAGFALCSTGIYLRDTAGSARKLSWSDFAHGKLAADNQNIVIDGSRIVTIDAAPLSKLLASIQKALVG